jgi:eukaryotic-like serine/threonine-protein kinase
VQEQRALRAQALAETRYAQVRRLAKGLVFSHHDQLVPIAGTIAVREALLHDAVGYLDGLMAVTPGSGPLDATLAREVAETYFRIATIQGEQFSPSQERLVEAQRHLNQALALLPRYVDDPAVEPEALNNAADMWLARASQEARFARIAASQQALQQAQALAQRVLQRHSGDLQAISRQATMLGRLALTTGATAAAANLGRVDEALQQLQQAVALFESLVQREPLTVEWQHQLAWACHLNTNALLLAGRTAEALVWGRRTLALRDEVARRQPDNPHYRYQKSTARLTLATALSVAGEHEAGLVLQDEAEAIVRATIAADRGNKAAQRDLSYLGYTRGRALVQAGRPQAARALLQGLLDSLPAPAGAAASATAEAPMPDFYRDRVLAETQVWLARAWLGTDPERALALARGAQPAMQGNDDNAARRWMLALAQGEEAAALQALGRPRAAAERATQALATWGGLAAPVPGLFRPWWERDRQLAAQKTASH